MTIGIVADNYKVGQFRKKLKSKNIKFEEHEMPNETTLLKCFTDKKAVIERLCQEVELHFKRGN